MLPRGKDDVRKGLLQSIVSLKNNPDFEAVMEYLDEAGQYCAAISCVQLDDILPKKYAGGFIILQEFKQLVDGAEIELEKVKKKGK